MSTLIDLDTLARCPTCTMPQLPGAGPCLYCRAVEAEGRLKELSFWGDDDWMRKIAGLALDDRRPNKALSPIGFELDLAEYRARSGYSVNVMARTQAPFRPVLLTVDPAVAVMGTLLDVKIGNMSQIWSDQPLPLTLFSPLHWASIDVMQEVVGRFKWGTANIAQDITLTIDLTLASYDPLIEEARKATGMPTPTKFRAALWGRLMDTAHQVIRLHRDIKPQNLLLAKGPHGRESIKVIDFGIAKVREDAGLGFTGIIGNTTGMVVGTPMYASPEQLEARGDIDRRSDLYSLGVVLYEMLTGKLPPPESIQQARPELSFPATLSALVTKALARDRERRFQTAEQMENEVLALQASANASSAGATRGGDRLALPMAETEVRAPSNPDPKVNPADGLVYVWVPPGSFTMGGSPGDIECDDDEKPARPVTIEKGYWLARTPVTQAAFEKVMGKNPSRVKGPRRPVESVTWEEARTYCEKVGGRLPTEAEWEYAARGNELGARYGNLGKIAWYSGNSGAQTHEVGKMDPNKFGLYDMLGNVWEWTADWYEAAWLERDKYRSVRGASCFDDPGFVRVSKRYKVEPGGRYGYLGFRCIT